MQNFIKYSVIILLSALLFLPFLGQVHLFDWDEINFAECAREMIATGDYLRVQINYQPFWEKPPLFIWMQVLSMKLLGVNEYAARFPNALMGIATIVAIFSIGKRVVNEKMATWWAFLYAATWLPHFYFKSGIIDPTFNFFIFLAFYQVYLLRFASNKPLHSLLAGLFLGLAVLTKGPVAILIALMALIVYIIVNKGLWGYQLKHLLMIVVFALLTTGIWFGIEVWHHGWWFVEEFITYQIRLFRTEDADHGGPFFYHFIVLLLGCFPASLFLFQYTRRRATDNEPARDFTKWMWVLFWVVLVLFSIVRTKIVHYSSLCYFPLTYLAALQIYRLSEGQIRIKTTVRILLIGIGSLLAVAIALLPWVGINKQKLIPLIDDPFAVANLQANVPWSMAESLWGILYLIAIWVGVLLMKKDFKRGMLVLGIAQIIIIQITVVHFTPKIEAYSQRAAIEYFKSLKGRDVYVHVLGYKSYAHWFYTAKPPGERPEARNEQWLLTGPIDKPAYFICKIMDAEKFKAVPGMQEIGRKNGFVFLKRMPGQ